MISILNDWFLQTSLPFYKHNNKIDPLLSMDSEDNFDYRQEKQRLPVSSHQLLEIDS